MKKLTQLKLSLLHAWQLPLKERLARWLIPMKHSNGDAFFEGICFAQNGCLIHVDSRNYIEFKIFAEGGYETYLSKLICHYIKPNSVFLDIGANIGIHTLSAASLSGVQIFAFEPIDFIREKLANNVALNKYTNVTIVPNALSDNNKTIKTNFTNSTGNQGTFSIENQADGETEIICIKGDDYILQNSISNVSVIKIDVEGFEYAVLSGLADTIFKQKPVIFFEYDTNYIGRNNKTHLDYENLIFNNLNCKIFSIQKSIIKEVNSFSNLNGMYEFLAFPK